MSMGIPIIIAKTKIDNYYFNDSVVKFFKPDDEKDLASAILELFKNDEIRKKLSENSLRFVTDFSWDIHKEKYFNILKKLGING